MQTLKPNLAAVAAKVIDGEAIIMNLTNGAYYSMTGVGAHIWQSIEQESNYAAILEGILTRYNIEAPQARVDLDALISTLLEDDLIIAGNDAIESASIAATTGVEVYEAPVLNKYTEMADLLALDPPMPSLTKSPTDA